jgi:putative transcriptional regulator
VLFETDAEKRWEAAAALMGIDIKQLTGAMGHA